MTVNGLLGQTNIGQAFNNPSAANLAPVAVSLLGKIIGGIPGIALGAVASLSDYGMTDPATTSDLSLNENNEISGSYMQQNNEEAPSPSTFYQKSNITNAFLQDMIVNNNQSLINTPKGMLSAEEAYNMLNAKNSIYNIETNTWAPSTDAAAWNQSNAQAEYEAAANAMEFPDNTPAGAISTLAGIGSGLLGGLQGKDEFGVYGQASDFAPDSTSNAQAEAESAMEGLGTTDVSSGLTGPSNEAFAEAMETPGLLGNVVSVPTTVASVGEVDDPAAVSGGFPGAAPGFNSSSYHSMGMDAFNAMANSSAANSMASQTGNAWNAFAHNFFSKNPNAGDIGLQNAWEASRTAAIQAATALSKNQAAVANINAGGGGSDGFDGSYGGGFDFSGGVDGIGEAGDSHSGWY